VGTGLIVAAGLDEALGSGELIVAPGVYDGLSARLAERSGFPAVYLTGYGVSASLLGQPDAGFLGLDHMADRVRVISETVTVPIVADADTGFGDVAATVKAYEAAGAAALQLEDQVFPKRCGHTPGRQVVPLEEAADRLKAALDARHNPAFKVIARTDARTSHGLEAAIERAQVFAELGADILFVESPESESELAQIVDALPHAKLLANMVEGGRTPYLTPDQLQDMGFALAIYPVMGLAAAAGALNAVYERLGGEALKDAGPMSFAELNAAVGFEEIWREDEKAAQS